MNCNEIEFYNAPTGEVLVKPKDAAVFVLTEEHSNVINMVLAYFSEIYTEAYQAVSELYSKSSLNKKYYEYLMAIRLIKCNLGEYDALNPDIKADGQIVLEEVKCPLRGICKHEGVICKPKKNTRLSTREIEVGKLCATMKYEEIAEELNISVLTVYKHIQNIKIKLNLKHSRQIPAAVESIISNRP